MWNTLAATEEPTEIRAFNILFFILTQYSIAQPSICGERRRENSSAFCLELFEQLEPSVKQFPHVNTLTNISILGSWEGCATCSWERRILFSAHDNTQIVPAFFSWPCRTFKSAYLLPSSRACQRHALQIYLRTFMLKPMAMAYAVCEPLAGETTQFSAILIMNFQRNMLNVDCVCVWRRDGGMLHRITFEFKLRSVVWWQTIFFQLHESTWRPIIRWTNKTN